MVKSDYGHDRGSSLGTRALRLPIGGRAKRAFDIGLAIAILTAISLVFLVIAVVVRIASPGPAFYNHPRVGFRGRSFSCLKFRTMVMDADEALRGHLAENEAARLEFDRTRKLRHDPRIIPIVGHFLRRTSLDELPQLLNVVRGEMSIVGPRPVTEEEVDRYGQGKALYFMARPGITGLWQVSGRSELTFEKRVALDIHYLHSWSLLRDLAILVRTLGVVVKREGAY